MQYNKLYLKITTIPNQLEVDTRSREIQVFRDKYEEHKGFLKDTDVELAYLNESAVNGSFARVYSITLGYVHDGFPIVKTLHGEETDLLDKLLSILRHKSFSNATLVMYNRVFVLSFLSKRFRKHKYNIKTLPISFDVYDKKPWTLKGSKCIQEFAKGISYQTENFMETCYIEDVEADFIPGSQVLKYIKREDYDLVHQSDISYVYALMQIDRQLSSEGDMGKMVLEIEHVGKVEKEDINVLDHILASGQLSSPVIEAIVDFTEENKLNSENVLTLVKTALSKTKEYQKVNEEEYIKLEEALGLAIDFDRIECVKEKGNLGKKEVNILVKKYENSSEEERKEVVELVELFLTKHKKMGQKRAKESFDFLVNTLTPKQEPVEA